MFLGVSETLLSVDLTDQQRSDLAALIRKQRIAEFGAKSSAYRAAGLNAATWDRLEAGQGVRDDRLIAALKTLWPDSAGDWRAVLGEPAQAGADALQRIAALERRMEDVERQLRKVMGDAQQPAPIDQTKTPPPDDFEVQEVNHDTFTLDQLDSPRERRAGQVRHGDTPG